MRFSLPHASKRKLKQSARGVLASSARVRLIILCVTDLAAALLDGLFEHPGWPIVAA